jgi:hypothetical protein
MSIFRVYVVEAYNVRLDVFQGKMTVEGQKQSKGLVHNTKLALGRGFVLKHCQQSLNKVPVEVFYGPTTP